MCGNGFFQNIVTTSLFMTLVIVLYLGTWKMYFGNPLRGYVVADYLLVEYAKIQSVISQQYMNIEHNTNGYYFYFSTKSRR